MKKRHKSTQGVQLTLKDWFVHKKREETTFETREIIKGNSCDNGAVVVENSFKDGHGVDAQPEVELIHTVEATQLVKNNKSLEREELNEQDLFSLIGLETEQKGFPFILVAETLDKLQATKSRLAITKLLSNLFLLILLRKPEDLVAVVYLCTNRISAPWEALEMGVGGSLITKAIVEVTGVTRDRLRSLYQKYGDLGDVAQNCCSAIQRLDAPQVLTVQQVYQTLKRIALTNGQKCVSRKKDMIKSLLVASRFPEARYIVRILSQHIRVGSVLKTAITALSRAFVIFDDIRSSGEVINSCIQIEKYEMHRMEEIKQLVEKMNKAYSESSNFEDILEFLLSRPYAWQQLNDRCMLCPGVPMRPQLGKITRSIQDMIESFEENAEICCEWKYDGQRSQIHILEDKTVKLFSRHLEDMTAKYPDVVAEFRKFQVQNAVLDAEIVAIDPSSRRYLPFQYLSTRPRKDVKMEQITVQVCVIVFDVMFVNHKSMLEESFRQRRLLLEKYFNNHSDIIMLPEALSCSDDKQIEEWLSKAIENGCEGLMCKAMDGPNSVYYPSKRSEGWSKIKKDYVDGMVDTLDLVPIAAWWGNGRKAGWLSPFLLACQYGGEFQSVCKVMSGFSDEQYKSLTNFYLNDKILPTKPLYYHVDENLRPAVWLQPCQVWEIRGAELTLSPIHRAGIGMIDSQRGISLRFPRFIKIREDKMIEDCTDSEYICEMYTSQSKNAKF
eukprot:jgi/Galph1/4801/GphlegSOOS_G3427.1